MTYGHEYNWLILIAIALAGALIRVFFVARHKGSASPVPIVVAAILLAAAAIAIAPRQGATRSEAVAFAEVRSIVFARCTSCHSAEPGNPAFTAAPAGVMFDTDAQIRAEATRIYQQSVLTQAMPVGNLTGMTVAERDTIGRWYQDEGGADER